MERRQTTEEAAVEQRSTSGVYRAVRSKALTQPHQELETERRVLGELFEAAPEAYLVTDELGVVIRANRRASELFKLHAGVLVGTSLLALLASPDRERIRHALGAMDHAVLNVQLRIQPHSDQRSTWVSVSAQRGVLERSPACVLWLFADIDVEKREEARRAALEERLRNRIRQLEAAQRSLGHLLEREQLARREVDEILRERERVFAEVAHELRGPLGSMSGWLHLLAGGDQPAESVQSRAVRSLTRSAQAMARVVEDMVAHARLENHAAVVQASPIDVVRLIAHVVDDLRPAMELKHIRVDVSCGRSTLEVNGDVFHLQQVFRNVIGNAIKFSPEHGSIRVTVSAVESDAEIAVTDTGPGIERGALERIFLPFTKLNTAVGHVGLGLGLSIAQRLVELHGGSIVAESAGLGRGATFRVRLPVTAARPPR